MRKGWFFLASVLWIGFGPVRLQAQGVQIFMCRIRSVGNMGHKDASASGQHTFRHAFGMRAQ